jgi:hypothetical protein
MRVAAALMHELSPGTSPPPVNMPKRMSFDPFFVIKKMIFSVSITAEEISILSLIKSMNGSKSSLSWKNW